MVPEPMAPEPLEPVVLPSGRFSGRQAFEQLVRDALLAAAQQDWKEIFFSDASFEDWPLQQREVAESLHAWAKPGRRFVNVERRVSDSPRAR